MIHRAEFYTYVFFFSADTEVSTPDGDVPIAEIEVGLSGAIGFVTGGLGGYFSGFGRFAFETVADFGLSAAYDVGARGATFGDAFLPR